MRLAARLTGLFIIIIIKVMHNEGNDQRVYLSLLEHSTGSLTQTGKRKARGSPSKMGPYLSCILCSKPSRWASSSSKG